MKTKVLVFFIVLLSFSLFAQQQRPRFGLEKFDVNRILAHLTDQLSLTDEQIEAIQSILLDTQEKLDEIKTKSYADDREMMQEYRAVMNENAELIESYLTEEQRESYKGDRPRMGRNR